MEGLIWVCPPQALSISKLRVLVKVVTNNFFMVSVLLSLSLEVILLCLFFR